MQIIFYNYGGESNTIVKILPQRTSTYEGTIASKSIIDYTITDVIVAATLSGVRVKDGPYPL